MNNTKDVPLSEKNQSYPNREQVEKDFMIFEDDLVLDLGCGPDPNAPEILDIRDSRFQRANVLVDQSLDLIRVYRNSGLKFVIANAEALPFKNKVFDFIWSSHLLEHTENPLKVCSEISRVGHRGRILTPTKFKELTRPNEFHLWMITQSEDYLTFEKKPAFLKSVEWKNVVYGEAMGIWFEKTHGKIPGQTFEIVFDWFDEVNYGSFEAR